jgi:4-hydroxy-2-oxoheptanedioate aldolase
VSRRLGTFVQIPSPQVVEILGYAGFDFVVIDGEHGAVNPETVESMIRTGEGVGIAPMVRVAHCDPASIRLPLDWGAAGVHVPQVESLEMAELAARSARFHPFGERGLQPFVRAAKYRSYPTAEFLAKANEEVTVVVHIEGRGGLRDLDAILATPGIDVVFLGPYDLSQALGIPGQVGDPRIESAILDAVAKRGSKTIGTYADTADRARYWFERGVDYVTLGLDAGHLLQATKGLVLESRI